MSDTEQPIGEQDAQQLRRGELADVSLRAPREPRKGFTEADDKEPVPPRDKNVQSAAEDRFQFASFVHNYVWANIILAEQKAALIFAADAAFAGYLLTTVPTSFWHIPPLERGLIAVALLLMISSICLVITVVVPHLGGNRQGLVYFNAIAGRSTNAEYTSAVLQASLAELAAATIQHNHEIARICARKYDCVRWATYLGLGGFAVGLIWLALTHTNTR